MQTKELSGEKLSYWVARALGYIDYSGPWMMHHDPTLPMLHKDQFKPHEDWASAGPIIELHKVALDPQTRNREPGDWQAQIWQPYDCQRGATPLEAAMRVFVGSVYGRSVPDEA